LSKAEITDGVIKLEEWESKYSPVQNEEGYEMAFETWKEEVDRMLSHIDQIKPENSKPYQHVWTRVDGDDGKLILLNGWHAVNRLDYFVTELPWGTGEDSDKDVYIEVKYED